MQRGSEPVAARAGQQHDARIQSGTVGDSGGMRAELPGRLPKIISETSARRPEEAQNDEAAHFVGSLGWSGVGGGPDPSADLLCQLDDDPLWAADVAEPVAVLLALQLADELSAAGSQAGDDGVDALDGECDSRTRRRVERHRGPDASARPEAVSLRPQHGGHRHEFSAGTARAVTRDPPDKVSAWFRFVR
jgi:hypothetical protein